MAIRSPGLVQVTTASTGSGPYTLTNVVPSSTDYRSIANAVADGSLANGDTVHYVIFQTGAPTGKMLERGWGTINTTTLVLTVLLVSEKSAALSSGGWGAGTKDVYFAPPGAESVALLEFANTFTQNQTIAKTNPAFNLAEGGVTRAALIYSADATYWQYYSAAPALQGQLQLANGALNYSNGSTTYKIVKFVGSAVVKMTFNCAPPTFWTRINVTGERVAKYATVSDTPEAQGGSWTISGLTTPSASTQAYTLQIADIPAHSHSILRQSSLGSTSVAGGGGGLQAAYNTEETGGGGSHAHGISSMTISSTGAWRPAYEIVVKASYD